MQSVTSTGELVVVIEVVNESDDDEFPGDRELVLLSVDGDREKETPDHLSDVEAFGVEWNMGWMGEYLFPDGLPRPPMKVEAKLHIQWIHTNNTDGEDWDHDVVINEWREKP